MRRTNPAQWFELVECRAGSWWINRDWTSLAVPLGLLVVLGWLFLPPTLNVYTDFRLCLDGRSATGAAIGSEEGVKGDDEGPGYPVCRVTYQFRTPDGRLWTGNGGEGDALPEELAEVSPTAPVPVTVEYCKSDPSISRWAGAGPKRSPWSILGSVVGLALFTAVLGNGMVQYAKQYVFRWVRRGDTLG